MLTSDYESCPLGVIEAMAAGVPVVATAVGGLPELVTEGEHGLLAPAGDVGALADAVQRLVARSGRRSRAWAPPAVSAHDRQLSRERMVAELEAVYAELQSLGKGRPSAEGYERRGGRPRTTVCGGSSFFPWSSARRRSRPVLRSPLPATGLIRLDGDIGGVHDAGRYSYVILNAWESNRIALLKAANPAVKVLVYKDMSSTRSYAVHAGKDDALLPTGVGYAAAEQAHAEWFLRDTHGDRVEWAGYDDHWWMDVGSASYQAAWLAAVQDEAVRNGWDGVFVDNAMADPQWYLGGRILARYPSASTYAAATRSFLAAVGPALLAKGLIVLPNISDASPEVWADWIHFTSGGLKEHWMKYPAAGSWFADWGFNYMQALLDATEAQNKIFIGLTASTADDVHSMRYARASFLVGWDGGGSALVYTAGKGVDPWSDEWTSDVGRPAAARIKVGSSAYRRDYTGGTALVNTSETASQTFELARSYLTPEGAPVTSITVQPRSGIVLRLPPGVLDFQAPSPPACARDACDHALRRPRCRSGDHDPPRERGRYEGRRSGP